jgi:hypothetical protein
MWVLTAIAATLVGCGGSPQELRSAEEASTFVGRIARGGKAGDWELADGAGHDAIRAWAHQTTIHNIGVKLHDDGPEWACETAERVEQAHKLIHGIGLDLAIEDRNTIVTSAENNGADEAQVNSLVEEALKLTDSELVKATAAVCGAAKQF